MKIQINIEKKHVYYLTALIFAVFGMLFVVAAIDTSKPFHHLRQIGKKVSGQWVSVDNNNNGKIDEADKVSWRGVQDIPADIADGDDVGTTISCDGFEAKATGADCNAYCNSINKGCVLTRWGDSGHLQPCTFTTTSKLGTWQCLCCTIT